MNPSELAMNFPCMRYLVNGSKELESPNRKKDKTHDLDHSCRNRLALLVALPPSSGLLKYAADMVVSQTNHITFLC